MSKVKEMGYGYMVGVLTAVVEDALPSIPEGKGVQRHFLGLVTENPVNLNYWLNQVLQLETELPPGLQSDLADLAQEYYKQYSPAKNRLTAAEQGQYFIGYHQQRARNMVQLTRQRLGLRIKELREAKGMDVRELGELCGLDPNHITRIESGKYNVHMDTLTMLGAVLGFETILQTDENEN